MPPQQPNNASGWTPVDDTSGWTPVDQDEGYHSVFSEEGKHPKTSKALSFLPAVGATVLGVAASPLGPEVAIPAAAAGGAAGKAGENQLREMLKFQPKQTSAGREAAGLAVEGVKQGAYEAGGRAVGALGGRTLAALRGVKPEVVGTTIGKAKMPMTMGQASGKPGGFAQTVEHYLSKTFLGGPLQQVKAAQAAATRQILADLSRTPEAVPGAMAANWERATQETKIAGGALYQQIGAAEAKPVAPVAAEILKDESILPIPAKARKALLNLAYDPMDEIAQGLGYKTAAQAESKMGGPAWKLYSSRVVKEIGEGRQAGTIQDALDARSELRDLSVGSRDRNLKRLYGDAWRRMDDAINKALTPEQKAIKEQADTLWRRSYIQERIAKRLQLMQNAQSPEAAPMVAVDSFVKTVNELAHEPLTRRGGEVVAKPSDLEVLFDNPADRKAMLDLATFLKEKYTTLGGQGGISESIARIGVALEGLRIPRQIATGAVKAATHGGMSLAALSAMSKVLANPGGARMLNEYFRSTGAGVTAGAMRIAGEALEQKLETSNVGSILPKQESQAESAGVGP